MTIGDVAEALGVSKTTVSRAISGKGRIGNETRERVLNYIEEHNFTPNAIAKGLAQSKTFNIGWVVPGDYEMVDLPFFQNCLMGISEVASPSQYDILVSMITANDITQLERAVTNHKIDGVILSRTLENDLPARYCLENKVPFVAIGSSDLKHVVNVDNDHKTACKELTSLLLMKGLRKFVLIGGNRTYIVTQNRLAGYRAAFAELSLEVDENSIYLDVSKQISVDEIIATAKERGAECVVCMDDSLACMALNAMKRMEIRIPEDMKLASFYNSAQLEANLPAVTALQFDAVALGREACANLINILEGREHKRHMLLGYDISLKESTVLR